VACKGTLADLFGFFTKLQSLDRLVRIERVSMDNDADLTGQVSLRMEAVIFEQMPKPRETQDPIATKAAGGGNYGV
jgi:hypothetical protein